MSPLFSRAAGTGRIDKGCAAPSSPRIYVVFSGLTMGSFRSLSADDVRGILRAFGAPGLPRATGRSPSGPSTPTWPSRPRTALASCASTRASRRTTSPARRRSSPTPPRAACPRRPRRARPTAGRSCAGRCRTCPPASRLRSSRCSPGCRAARWCAPRSRPPTRARSAPRWRACTWPATAFADRRPGRYEPDEIDRRLALVTAAASARTELAPAVAILTPELAALHRERHAGLPLGLIHGDLFIDNTLFDAPAGPPAAVGNAQLTALLDFEQASWGRFAYDVAVTLLAFAFGRDDFRADVVRALLDGYAAVRSPTAGGARRVRPRATLRRLPVRGHSDHRRASQARRGHAAREGLRAVSRAPGAGAPPPGGARRPARPLSRTGRGRRRGRGLRGRGAARSCGPC